MTLTLPEGYLVALCRVKVSTGMHIRAWSSEGWVTPSNEVILRSDESSVICACEEGSGGITPVRGHMED